MAALAAAVPHGAPHDEALARAGEAVVRQCLALSGADDSFERRCHLVQLLGAVAQRPRPRRAHAADVAARRLVDLRPVTEQHCYHPDQHGKWGLKSVLPTLGGGADHSQLEGVADGQMAVDAYLEATDPDTSPHRVEELRQQLLTYCRLDTWAMMRLWAFLVGRPGVVEGEGVRVLPDPQH